MLEHFPNRLRKKRVTVLEATASAISLTQNINV